MPAAQAMGKCSEKRTGVERDDALGFQFCFIPVCETAQPGGKSRRITDARTRPKIREATVQQMLPRQGNRRQIMLARPDLRRDPFGLVIQHFKILMRAYRPSDFQD